MKGWRVLSPAPIHGLEWEEFDFDYSEGLGFVCCAWEESVRCSVLLLEQFP